jgi:hypothetical protein
LLLQVQTHLCLIDLHESQGGGTTITKTKQDSLLLDVSPINILKHGAESTKIVSAFATMTKNAC